MTVILLLELMLTEATQKLKFYGQKDGFMVKRITIHPSRGIACSSKKGDSYEFNVKKQNNYERIKN